MKKIFYFDVETTGRDPVVNDIIQLAGIIEINGKVVESVDLRIRPFDMKAIDQQALDVNGVSVDDLASYPEPHEQYRNLITILTRHVDKYDRADKFYPAGYNVRFDIEFLKQFFLKNGDSYFGSMFNYRAIDPLYLIHYIESRVECELSKLPNLKLETVCHHYGISINAHDALSDITATRELLQMIGCGEFESRTLSYPLFA